MARLRRRVGSSAGGNGGTGLTCRQTTSLVIGIELGADADFASVAEYEAAWWNYREDLLYSLRPFKHGPMLTGG